MTVSSLLLCSHSVTFQWIAFLTLVDGVALALCSQWPNVIFTLRSFCMFIYVKVKYRYTFFFPTTVGGRIMVFSFISAMSGGGNFFTNKFWGNTNQGYYPIIDNRLAHLEPLLGLVNQPNTKDSKDPLLHAKPISDPTPNIIPKEAARQVAVTICQSGGGPSDPSQSGDSDNSSSDSEDNNFQVENLEEEKEKVEPTKVKEKAVKEEVLEKKG